jgi:hypothetical protein
VLTHRVIPGRPARRCAKGRFRPRRSRGHCSTGAGAGVREGRPHRTGSGCACSSCGGGGGPSGCASSSSATRSRWAATRSSARRGRARPRSGSTRGPTFTSSRTIGRRTTAGLVSCSAAATRRLASGAGRDIADRLVLLYRETGRDEEAEAFAAEAKRISRSNSGVSVRRTIDLEDAGDRAVVRDTATATF